MGEQKEWLTFAELLKDYRTDMGVTQTTFGEMIGYSAQYVCDIEKGHRTPSVEFVNAFCRSMNMDKGEATIWHRLGARASGWEI